MEPSHEELEAFIELSQEAVRAPNPTIHRQNVGGVNHVMFTHHDWRYHSISVGTVCPNSLTVIYWQGTAVWSMFQQGGLIPGLSQGAIDFITDLRHKSVIQLIKSMEGHTDSPVAGEKVFCIHRGDFVFTLTTNGDALKFTRTEVVSSKDKEYYRLTITGGIVQ